MRLDVATVLNGTMAASIVVRPDGSSERGNLLSADLVREFSDAVVDSRAATRDSLFVALPGERADGHDFVGGAVARGARGAIVTRAPDLPPEVITENVYLFLVPDALVALQRLATYWRNLSQARIIGVTGSVGKTTTKDITASLLGTAWPVLASEANLNTEIGLPLMLLRLRPEHRAGIFEMGMYLPGDIALLTQIARPHTGIVTTIAPIHLERMGTIEAIAREKSRLIAGLPSDGLAILNADDPWTRAMAVSSGLAPSVLVGLADDADLRADGIQPLGLDGLELTVHVEGRSRRVRTRVPGRHTVHAVLSAVAVARSLRMQWDDIVDGLATVRLESRQRILRPREDVLLIDDTYNASPPSMAAALDLLAHTEGQKVCVLGDMLELGGTEFADHLQVGKRAATICDWLVTRGSRAAWIAEGARASGMDAGRITITEGNDDATQAVRRIIGTSARSRTMRRPGGTVDGQSGGWAILCKGSRGMRMEEIVDDLRGNAW